MNAVVAVAHCPLLPADTSLDHVGSTSEILNAGGAPFLTSVGMAHLTGSVLDAWRHDDLDVVPERH